MEVLEQRAGRGDVTRTRRQLIEQFQASNKWYLSAPSGHAGADDGVRFVFAREERNPAEAMKCLERRRRRRPNAQFSLGPVMSGRRCPEGFLRGIPMVGRAAEKATPRRNEVWAAPRELRRRAQNPAEALKWYLYVFTATANQRFVHKAECRPYHPLRWRMRWLWQPGLSQGTLLWPMSSSPWLHRKFSRAIAQSVLSSRLYGDTETISRAPTERTRCPHLRAA